MSASPVIVRYARSLVDLAIEKNELDAVHQDMKVIADSCAGSRDLQLLLKSPVIKSDKKAKILNKVFAGRIGSTVLAFIDVLVRKGRESNLYEVTKAVDVLYKEHKHIKTFEVTTAQALDDEGRAKVVSIAKELHGEGEVELVELVDPTLIGGVILRHGDEQWDGSVSRKLHDLKRNFSKNPYIAEI